MTLPFLSNRKHSVRAVLDRRRLSLSSTRSLELHESCRLASGEGGASARLDAAWAHTASIIGSKIGTATPPPVEPLPRDSPLLGRDNVILTPHTAFYSVEALDELQTKCATDVARVLSGEKPVYPVKL